MPFREGNIVNPHDARHVRRRINRVVPGSPAEYELANDDRPGGPRRYQEHELAHDGGGFTEPVDDRALNEEFNAGSNEGTAAGSGRNS